MGRMADARKRARRGGAAPPPPPDEPAAPSAAAPEAAPAQAPRPEEAAPETEVGAVPTPAGEAEPEASQWVAREELLIFQGETAAPAGEPGGRLVLPSSGLAEDILGAVEAAEASPVPTAEEPEAAGEPAPGPARSHSLSFFGAPLRTEAAAVEASEHLVTFLLAQEEYGVDVRLVQEIIRVTSITAVPRAPEFIRGVINLRGRIIPVVDLRRKLGLGDVDERSRRARIVVVRLRERLIGVLVDGASQVLKVPVSVIEAAPEEVVSIAQSFIRGVAKLEKRLIILIALQDILVPELREAPAQELRGA